MLLQPWLFDSLPQQNSPPLQRPPNGQLLKWIGNKHRMAAEIVSYFPKDYREYREPFLGSGAVLATLCPKRAVGSDSFPPLMEIWQALKQRPEQLKRWYRERWEQMVADDKIQTYERIKASFNARPNGADFVFLARSCYGGVIRFRKADGYMSTPCGAHHPISPATFAERVDKWRERIQGAAFVQMEYPKALAETKFGDLVYCDPPYSKSQSILYGGQDFDLGHLLELIASCKRRGTRVALSIDGSKKSGSVVSDLPIPPGLFEREVFINVGRSMLKRFQMGGQSLERHVVADRLLLTY